MPVGGKVQGNAIVGASYTPVPPGVYVGRISKLEYKRVWSSNQNKEFLQLALQVEVSNNGIPATIFTNLTIGAVAEKGSWELVRLDGDKEKSPIFGGKGGASGFMAMLGCVDKATHTWALPEANKFADFMVLIAVEIRKYVKEGQQRETNEITSWALYDPKTQKAPELWDSELFYVDKHGFCWFDEISYEAYHEELDAALEAAKTGNVATSGDNSDLEDIL